MHVFSVSVHLYVSSVSCFKGDAGTSLYNVSSNLSISAEDIHTTMCLGLTRSVLCLHEVCLFVLRLNVPVNNFSVMSGWSHRFLGN